MSHKLLTLLLCLPIIANLFLIVLAPAILELPLLAQIGLPLGNVTIWIGLMALPSAVLAGLARPRKSSGLDRFSRALLWLSLFAASCWLAAGYLLSGNWGFNFYQEPGRSLTFTVLTVALVLIPVAVLLLLLLRRMLARRGILDR